MTRYDRRTKTAYHEAGHAVVAWRLGVGFRYVTIRPDEDSFGHLMYDRTRAVLMKHLNEGGETLGDIGRAHRACVVAYAGGIAVRRLTGRAAPGTSDDCQKAFRIATCLSGGLEAAAAFVEWCSAVAEQFVECLWDSIVAVAEALLARERLSKAEVFEVAGSVIEARFPKITIRQINLGA